MWQTLNEWDIALFLRLNNIGCKALDPVFMWITDYAFVPFGALALYLLWHALGWRRLLLALAAVALAIALSDQTCGVYIRDMHIRLRPCHMDELAGRFRSVREWETGYCGGQYGFVSAHAGNAYALAVFTTLVLWKRVRRVGWYMLGFATLIAYSRIYIGTHLTGDVIVGGAIGAAYAALCAWLYRCVSSRVFRKNVASAG